MGIMKVPYKLHTHKTREHKLLKAQKIKELKMLKPKQQIEL
jgi:hypothetical protein